LFTDAAMPAVTVTGWSVLGLDVPVVVTDGYEPSSTARTPVLRSQVFCLAAGDRREAHGGPAGRGTTLGSLQPRRDAAVDGQRRLEQDRGPDVAGADDDGPGELMHELDAAPAIAGGV
jgi:hypothetical protein